MSDPLYFRIAGQSVAASSVGTNVVAEMRVDDIHDDQPSALMRMGYPTLREAFRHPDELREVIRVYLDREILCAFAPYTPRVVYTVNSTDAITVGESSVTIRGRCFARPDPTTSER